MAVNPSFALFGYFHYLTNQVNPYSMTLNWADKPPGGLLVKESNRSAAIESISWNKGPGFESASARMPPGDDHVLSVETTGGRVVRLLATNWLDYQLCLCLCS
jgi:hypothetical protein